jgi:uncharacterized protein (DUF983 family)
MPEIRVFVLFILFYLLGWNQVEGQTIQPDIGLYSYLIQNEYLNEAKVYANSFISNDIELCKSDSFLWWKAHYFEKTKQFDSASIYFSYVNENSMYYAESSFKSALYLSLNRNYSQASDIVVNNKLTNYKDKNLSYTFLASIDLLNKDIPKFDNDFTQIDTNYFAVKEAAKSLVFIRNDRLAHKQKSAFLAAGMSTLIPGCGKLYAGKTGEAFSSFITVAALGAMCYENASKYGFNHSRTYFTVGIFGVFYLGNILGSYYSVNRENLSFDEKMEKNILYSMQHSLHLAFH